MSAKITGKVWELDLDPTEKLVLLALSDHADHDGNHVRPGNELLMQKTGLSERTIGTKIQSLVEKGILVEVNTGTGRGQIREYSIDIKQGKRRAYFTWKDGEKVEAASTFSDPKRSKQGPPLEGEKVETDSTFEGQKVEIHAAKGRNPRTERSKTTAEKVENGACAYKEGTVMNRHEPSREPERDPFALAASELESKLDAMKSLVITEYRIAREGINGNFEKNITSQVGILNALGCTPDLLQAFFKQRRKLPGLGFLAENWQTWATNESRAPMTTQPGGSNGNHRNGTASPGAAAFEQAAERIKAGKVF